MKSLSMVVFIVVIIALLPAICMWLWNWLMPDIFGTKQIDYWQAIGLMLLSSCFLYRGNSRSSSQ